MPPETTLDTDEPEIMPLSADEMTATYRRFYADNHETMLRLYPGIGDAIAALHTEGYRLGVVD